MTAERWQQIEQLYHAALERDAHKRAEFSDEARAGDSAIRAFIQAGGRSSRMGADKAWIEINGQPLIEHVLTAARLVAASLSIIISADNPNAERYRQLADERGAGLLLDLHDHQGPLGGIHTALKHCAANEAALILACDLPFITTEFLSLLCTIHQDHNPQSAIRNPQSITVPLDAEGRLQPLAAIYAQACLPAVEAQLAARQLRVDLLFNAVPTQQVAFSDFAHLPGAAQFFLNLNSPEDLSFVVKPQTPK